MSHMGRGQKNGSFIQLSGKVRKNKFIFETSTALPMQVMHLSVLKCVAIYDRNIFFFITLL